MKKLYNLINSSWKMTEKDIKEGGGSVDLYVNE